MASLNDTNGTRGHLTPTQTRILYKLWQRFFRLCETPAGYGSSSVQTTVTGTTSTSAESSAGRRVEPSPCSSSGEKQAGPSSPLESTTKSNLDRTTSAQSASASYGKPIQRQPSRSRQIDERGSHIPKDDKVKDELKTIEEAKEMREFLEKHGGEKLREVFWDMVKGEHPDAIMLRILRARKWDIDRAIAVIGSTAAFRVDNDVKKIVKGGELELTRTKGGMKIFTNGISYTYGATSIGEPVYIIEVGNHFSHNQTQEELKRGVILLQEWLQLLMPPPIERKIIIFNMNEFGIRNMDWWCVFFMVKTMESYYVETLARVYVHGAPWIFRPIWAVLKPLLDPVVRDKIRLTSLPEELAEHIPLNHLPKGTMRGDMDWEFEYVPPTQDENDIQLDVESHDKFAKAHQKLTLEFERATREICNLYTRSSMIQRAKDGAHQDYMFDSDGDDVVVDENGIGEGEGGPSRGGGAASSSQTNSSTPAGDEIGQDLKAKRDVLATRLRVAFLRLRPYIVGHTLMSRQNNSRSDGSIYWEYKSVDGTVEKQLLGQGTTLPELERNLELLDEALNSTTSSTSTSLPIQNLQSLTLTDRRTAKQQEEIKENNRQKRLRNRTKTPDKPSDQTEETQSTTVSDGQSNANSSSTITPGDATKSITQISDPNDDDEMEKEDEEEEVEQLPKPVPVHPLRDHSRTAL